MCLGMFTAIPCPYRPWEERLRPLMTAFLPVLGLLLGALWLLLSSLARAVLPMHMFAVIVVALPFLLTGFIHLDGFMDTVDAVRSWRDMETRRTILKDVHCGAFAVAGAIFLILAMFACALDIGTNDLRPLFVIPAVSRAMSAISVTLLKPITHSEYSVQSHSRAVACSAMATMCLALIASGLWLGGRGVLIIIAVIVVYALAMLRAYQSLGGVSGDLAGYALCLGELAGLAATALL